MRFCPVVKSTFKGTKFRGSKISASTKLRVRKLSALCLPENAFSANWRNHSFKVSRKEWEYNNHILYFLLFSEMRNLRFKLGKASLGFVWFGLA